jgi:deazaflavin-dependent oxidoreductase (nitroreductase family)
VVVVTPTPDDLERFSGTRTVDLTTVGRRSGQPRTVEIWWFHVDGRFIITGTPGRRDWLANVRADPAVVISDRHGSYHGIVEEIHDEGFRRRVFEDPQIGWYSTQAELGALVSSAPMIEVHFT